MECLKEAQILTSNYPYYRYSLEYALRSLQKIGTRTIEFYACYPHFHIDDVNGQDLKKLKRTLADHELQVRCFTPEQCQYPIDIAASDLAARKRSMEVFQKSIQYAAELEAQYVVVLAGHGTLDESEENIWKRSVESVHTLGKLAEEYGIEIVLETSPREYTTTHSSKDVLRMIEEAGSSAVKGMIDTATLGYSGETIEEAIGDLRGHLAHVHVADGVPNGHLVLGEGNLDIRAMLKSLDKAGYQGALSLEILNEQYAKNPHKAMKASYERLKEYLKNQ